LKLTASFASHLLWSHLFQ